MNDKYKIKEISASLSGVIPVASYENLRPNYSMTVEPIGEQRQKKFLMILKKSCTKDSSMKLIGRKQI